MYISEKIPENVTHNIRSNHRDDNIDECTLSVIFLVLNCFELCPRQGAGGSHVVLGLISNKKCFILLKKQ